MDQFQKKNYKLNICVKSIVQNYLQGIEKNVTINYNLKSDLLLDIEITTFYIILENLLSNAIKFS
ncbi:MAG: hypothetical protein Q8S84_01920 [bacterium]|nr:hypothetical protein [bacterium]MDP3380313.1 hypothetical protein [bacterium]